MLSLREAREKIDNLENIDNIYDAYVFKKDWEGALDGIDKQISISENLIKVESSCGILPIELLLDELYFQLEEQLQLPDFGYKYDIPVEVEVLVKEKRREIKERIKELEEERDRLLDSVFVEDEIFDLKY